MTHPRPTYNHTRGDSKLHPCDQCAIGELEIYAILTGRPDQLERWEVGLLPQDELLALARTELFKPFDGLPRWNSRSGAHNATIRWGDVRHKDDCSFHKAKSEDWEPYVERLKAQGAIRFEATPADELGADQWRALKEMTALANRASQHAWLTVTAAGGEVFAVAPRAHTATCTMCAEEIYKASALVSVKWAGRLLSREYVL